MYLNMVLDTLNQIYDLDYISKPTTVNFVAGTTAYSLPADHLRTREVFYKIDGVPFNLRQIDIRDYHALFNAPSVDTYPYTFAVDVSTTPHNLLPYPPPSIVVPVTVIYFPRIPNITTPEVSLTVPWFLNQEYLVTKVAAKLMLETSDERAAAFDAAAEKLLNLVLIQVDDKEGYAQTIKLSGKNFRPRGISRPSKLFPLEG
jgi:hypothetical protein